MVIRLVVGKDFRGVVRGLACRVQDNRLSREGIFLRFVLKRYKFAFRVVFCDWKIGISLHFTSPCDSHEDYIPKIGMIT